ncbi:MAG TPA: AAA family ATPase [Pyrinomonadaceae bacterium]|nr:AAA family ATPase [Pyrinomonadaceae bacterium]
MVAAAQISNPFPGLRPFEPHQADLFFGRDEQVEELLDRLEQRRFLAVVGTSGSGKSSLVRAGLIPTLQGGYFAKVGKRWRTTIFRPGSDPKVELARSLAATFGLPDKAEALAILDRSSLGLAEFARKYLKEGESLLLVVDQFEEVFRYRGGSADRSRAEEASAFVKLLLVATGHSELPLPEGDDLPVYVILTMRSDFLGKCSRFRGLPEALNDSQYLVPRMTREQQLQAIEGPIEMAGARISPQLIQRLLNDVGDNPDQLPVLQHALMRTWEQSADARARGVPIDISDYGSSGEMRDALNIDAERAFAQLDGEENRRIARRIFQRLVEPSAKDEETRRPAPLSQLVAVTGATEEQVREVIGVFLGAGFLTMSADKDPVVDITHESLIRLWKRLNKWVAEEAESARIYSRLADTARKGGALYRDPELTEALRWEKDESPNAAWAQRYPPWDSSSFQGAVDFLERSRKEQERQQAARRRTLFLLAGGLIAVSALAVLVVIFWIRANRLRAEAEGQRKVALGQRLGVVADTLSKGPGKLNQRSLLLALESYRAFNYIENDRVLRQVLAKSPLFVRRMKHDGTVTALRFSPDGKLLLSGSSDKTARVWEAASGKETARLQHPYELRDMFLSPDARYVVTTCGEFSRELYTEKRVDSPGVMRLWEWGGANVGRMLAEQPFPRPVWAAAFNAAGTRLLSSDGSLIKSMHLDDPSVVDEATVAGGYVVVISDTASHLAVGVEDGSIHVVDGKSLQTVRTIQHPRIEVGEQPASSRPVFLSEKLLATQTGLTGWSGLLFLNPVSGKQAAPPLDTSGGNITLSHNSELAAEMHFGLKAGFAVWNLSSRKEPWTANVEGPDARQYWPQIIFSPDDTRLAINSGGLVVRVYSVPEQRELFRISTDTQVSRIAFSLDNEYLAVGEEDGTLTVWRLQSGGEHRIEPGFPNFSPGGKFVEFSEPSQTTILDRNDGHQIVRLPNSSNKKIFSQDDRYFAFADAGEDEDEDEKIHVYDLIQKQELPAITPGGEVVSLQFNSPAGLLAVATRDGAVTKWKPASGEQAGRFETGTVGDIFGGYNVIFSRDARTCAVTTKDDEFQLWDVEKGIILGKVPGDTFWEVWFSPDGKLMAILTDPRGLSVWRTDKVQEVWRAPLDQFTGVKFSPDGQSIAAGLGQNITIWEAATGRPLRVLKNESEVERFAFTPDSKYLAATYREGMAYIWLLQSGTTVSQIALDQPKLLGGREIQFTPDGRFLVVEDSRKEYFVRTVWWHPGDLINEACKRLSRNLTTEEWQQYLPTEPYRKTCPNLP